MQPREKTVGGARGVVADEREPQDIEGPSQEDRLIL